MGGQLEYPGLTENLLESVSKIRVRCETRDQLQSACAGFQVVGGFVHCLQSRGTATCQEL